MPNKISRFWQELKRRNVVRVLTVYAGAAFVIIELINNITEPLHLPEWTPTLVIVLLAIGFPVVIIFSWIYDVHPEGGIVKTEPAEKVKAEEIPKSSNGWKIASYISFVVIVVFIVIQITSGRGNNRSLRNLEKSIAVLSFENMGSDPEFAYLGGAFSDEIIMELQKIKSFDRVLPRTSTMQYDENRPAIPEIAEELDVNFLVTGSIQKHKDQVRVRVTVTRAKQEDLIWAHTYNDPWESIFTIQDQIAFDVAHELQAFLSPEEIARIEKRPTSSLEANYFYLRGREEYIKSGYYGETQGSLNNAKANFLKALEYDPGFAAAYAGLARVSLEENQYRSQVDTAHTDSTLILIDQALSFDDELADAYLVRGDYYRISGNFQQAIRDMKKAIELNPSYWLAYQILAYSYSYSLFEFELAFENLQKALQLQKGILMENILYDIGSNYRQIGFFDQARSYYKKVLDLNGDTLAYLARISTTELIMGNYKEHLRLEQQVFERDSSLIEHFYMGNAYRYNGQFEISLYHYEKSLESPTREVERMLSNSWHRIGYVYLKNGMVDSAYECFNRQIEICERAKGLNTEYFVRGYASYDLAGIYTFMGDKVKAYENLRAFSSREKFASWAIPTLKSDPLFDSIRDEPEFQQIVREVEAKHQAEHERVRQWLEENEML